MLWLKTENTNIELEVSIKVHVKGRFKSHISCLGDDKEKSYNWPVTNLVTTTIQYRTNVSVSLESLCFHLVNESVNKLLPYACSNGTVVRFSLTVYDYEACRFHVNCIRKSSVIYSL